MSNFPVTIRVHVTKSDITEGKCKLPNKCMLKLAIKREIGGHGYVHVEGGVASVTRRPDYREKGFLPRPAQRAMLAFDAGQEVKPFTFSLKLIKTTKIHKYDSNQWAHKMKKRDKKKASGWKPKKYNMRQRIAGIAIGGEAAAV